MIMKEGYDLGIMEDCSAGLPTFKKNIDETVFIQ